MKSIFFAMAAVVSLWLAGGPMLAADNPTAVADLNDLIGRINSKLTAGKNTEADLADNLKEFDVLLVKHKGEDPEDVAHIPAMKANLYMQVLHDSGKAAAVIAELQHDFPNTALAKNSRPVLENLEKMIAADKIRSALVERAPFPDFNEKDLNGRPLSIAQYKGKVVLVDFWATWCGPCRAELPNVVKTYEKYHDKGFEIIGISLDHPEDREKLAAFIRENKMTWPQYFDGEDPDNKLAVKYGVYQIPWTYLLDGGGKIIAQGLRGDALEAAVAKALGGT